MVVPDSSEVSDRGRSPASHERPQKEKPLLLHVIAGAITTTKSAALFRSANYLQRTRTPTSKTVAQEFPLFREFITQQCCWMQARA
jgi:hypothetical protein